MWRNELQQFKSLSPRYVQLKGLDFKAGNLLDCSSFPQLRPAFRGTHLALTPLADDVSALPVVDDKGALVDVYARNDITALARDRIYTRVQLQDLTLKEVRVNLPFQGRCSVQEVLSLSNLPPWFKAPSIFSSKWRLLLHHSMVGFSVLSYLLHVCMFLTFNKTVCPNGGGLTSHTSS